MQNFHRLRFLKRIGFTEILFFLFFLSIFIFVFLYFHNTKKWINVEMKVTTDPSITSEYRSVPHWLINTVKKGDKEYDGFGQPVAEVIDIKTYDTWGSYKETYEKLRLNVLYNKNQHKYTYSSKDLMIGGPISVKPNGILSEGVITSIEGISDERKKVHKKVLVTLENGENYTYITTGIEPWIAEAVKVGDEMKDFDDHTIAKVLEKKVKPASRRTVDANGNPHLVQDPYLVDMNLIMDVETIYDKGIYYFRENQKVEINQVLHIHTEKYDFGFLVTDILE